MFEAIRYHTCFTLTETNQSTKIMSISIIIIGIFMQFKLHMSITSYYTDPTWACTFSVLHCSGIAVFHLQYKFFFFNLILFQTCIILFSWAFWLKSTLKIQHYQMYFKSHSFKSCVGSTDADLYGFVLVDWFSQWDWKPYIFIWLY